MAALPVICGIKRSALERRAVLSWSAPPTVQPCAVFTASPADPEPADYPAGFRFTNDLKWLVRMQKTGSGESTLYLYRLGPQGFVPATKKPLGELAWAYFKSRPEWQKAKKDPEYHISANLLKGTEENLARCRLAGKPVSPHRPFGGRRHQDPQAHADRRGEWLALQI